MQSCLDLMHVAGYENREQDFESLIRILDSELRLITPIDLDGLIAEGNLSRPGEGNNGSERFYHLTHDYLVPSIQEWLTRKQRETRKGRAELLLSERSGLWKHRTSHQNLLSIFELMNVAWYVPRVFRRIDDEQALFKASVKFQGTRILFVMAVVGVITFAISEQTKRFQMTELIDSLVNASTSDVPRIVERMEPFRSRAAPRLNQLLKTSEPDSLMHHHVAMALLPSDLTQVPGVVEHLLTSNATDFVALNQLMERYRVKDSVKQQLWKELTDHDRDGARRFRAAAALATLEQKLEQIPSTDWETVSEFLAHQFIAEIRQLPGSFDIWIHQFTRIQRHLIPHWNQIFLSESAPAGDRLAVSSILAEYLAADSQEIANLVVQSTAEQYLTLMPKLHQRKSEAVDELTKIFHSNINPGGLLHLRLSITKQRAFAAAALFDLEISDSAMDSLASESDPDLRTYTSDRMSQLVIHPEYLQKQLETAGPFLCGTLLRTLGAMEPARLTPKARSEIVASAKTLFEQSPDAGIHSAAGWLLGKYQELPAKTDTTINPDGNKKWYVTPEGHSMVVFRGPIQSKMGSPHIELNHEQDEHQTIRIIQRDFALSSTEVTLDQFVKAHPEFRHKDNEFHFSSRDCPVALVTWHHACVYCVWLSKQEGIPKDQICYQLKDNSAIPYPDYLQRTGYRLPTEAEWEYACRAGSTSPFWWGSDPKLSNQYCWSLENSESWIQPVGMKCPNPFGLFDMHGNVAEWCQDPNQDDLSQFDNQPDQEFSVDTFEHDSQRTVRGGHVGQQTPFLRSANRTPIRSQTGLSAKLGFRIARTIPNVISRPD